MSIKQISQNLLSNISGGMNKIGMPAPKYLSIPEVKSCLDTKDNGLFQELCMPRKRPEACPEASWELLLNLDENQAVKSC